MAVEDPSGPTVIEDRKNNRFVVMQDGAVAFLAYEIDADRLVLTHTWVPESIGRRGIGATLVRDAVLRAAEDRLTVVPWCSFARSWLHDHPEVADAVTIDWESQPPS